MRRQAKATPAGSIFIAIFLVLALGAANAYASKGGNAFIGISASSSGNAADGGLFNTPQDIAVNHTGAGGVPTGTIYVVESTGNRVQRLSPSGAFVLAWGKDVIESGKPNDVSTTAFEVCDTTAATPNVAADCKIGTNTSPARGGILSAPRGIAVDQDTGNVYVFDNNNVRVEVFGPAGQFLRAWGADVVATGPGNAGSPPGSPGTPEVQRITVKATSGTFTLSFGGQTTGALAFDAPASGGVGPTASVENALNALSTIGGVSGSVSVSGGPGDATGSTPYTITFGAALGGQDIAQTTISPAGLGVAVGTQLSCSTLTSSSEVKYQWLANGTSLGSANGAQTPNYTVQPTDAGKVIQCQVFSLNTTIGSGSATQVSSGMVASSFPSPAPPVPPNNSIAAPTGTANQANVGNKLTCSAGTWTGVTLPFAFQWYRNGVPLSGNGADTNQYTLQAADVVSPASFQCAVTGSNVSGSATKISSNRNTTEAPGAPSPAPSPNANVAALSTAQTITPGTSVFEICVAADGDVCKAGVPGSGPGFFNSENLGRLAVSPPDGNAATGFVYVGDSNGSFINSNNRMQKFNLDGTTSAASSISLFGGSNNVARSLVVDASGIVYVEAGGIAGIHRYDPSANGGAGSFLSPLNPSLAGEIQAMEIDPSNGHLLATVNPSDGDTVIEEFANPSELSPTLVDTHMQSTGDQITNGLGLIHNGGSDRLYVSAGSGTIGHRVLVLDGAGVGPATMAMAPPGDVESTSATLRGTVTPNGPAGFATSYRFQYSDNGVDWTAVAPVVNLGEGFASLEVDDAVTGLEPNTFYRVRLLTQKFANPPRFSSEQTLLTDAPSPEATTLAVHSFTDDSARLAGLVTPNKSSTTYYFQWGLTTKYSARVPLPSGNAGSGAKQKVVLEEIEGLHPETTYHYRVIAESDQGIDVGEDYTFTTRAPFNGFPERAYEQVSPIDKVNTDVNEFTGFHPRSGDRLEPTPVSDSGDSKVIYSLKALGNQDWGGNINQFPYVVHRTQDGWSEPKSIVHRLKTPTSAVSGDVQVVGGRELSRAMILEPNGFVDIPGQGLFHSDLEDQKISQLDESLSSRRPAFSDDLDSVAFQSKNVLTARPDTPNSSIDKVYGWTPQGIELVAVQDGGAAFATGSEIGGISSALNSVSQDGAHVFFSTPSESSNFKRIYRRFSNSSTTLVSPSKRTPPDPAGTKAKNYLDSTPRQGPEDPATVFFSSTEKLTNDATNGGGASEDLYRYEINEDTLTNISAETNTAQGARVLGMLGASADGETVYYAARGQIVAGLGIEGKPNVYRWHDDGSSNGETHYVATLAENGVCPNGLPSTQDACNYVGNNQRTARVSSDGNVLLLQSAAPLTGYLTQGQTQIYLYEATANKGLGALTCVSCPPTEVSMPSASFVSATDKAGQRFSSALASDGSRVVFESKEALLPADVNQRVDVYEWSAGRLAFVSTGKSTDDSEFDGATPDGSSIFFTTREQLVGQDVDGVLDVYVAREGGGLASQQAPPPPGVPCQAEGCKPSMPAEVDTDIAPSSAAGSGNLSESGASCADYGHRSKRLSDRAKRVQGQAAAEPDDLRAERLRKVSRRLERQAKQLGKQAKRCRSRQREAAK